jgi:hypothetical protein
LDYYAVLGVARNASADEIERAYKALARKVHPDRNASDAERADARMKQLNQIRDTLTDPLLRAAYDDRLSAEQRPAPPPPRRDPPPAPAEHRWRQSAPSGYQPHPHVAPFLHTNVEAKRAAARPSREARPAVALLLVGALTILAAILLWPRPEPPRERLPIAATAVPPRPAPPRPAVVVVRGDTAATRQAIRKTARVVPVGLTMDEVIARFGPPDQVESHPAPGDLTLIYGKVKVELIEGKVVGGAP